MKIDARPQSVVRIKPEVYDELVRLADLTRKPIGVIASAAIECGLAHSSVTPVQQHNISFDGEVLRKGSE